jgi:hypothetical protein
MFKRGKPENVHLGEFFHFIGRTPLVVRIHQD